MAPAKRSDRRRRPRSRVAREMTKQQRSLRAAVPLASFRRAQHALGPGAWMGPRFFYTLGGLEGSRATAEACATRWLDHAQGLASHRKGKTTGAADLALALRIGGLWQ